MQATKHRSNNNSPFGNSHFEPLKRKAERAGFSYSTVRRAATSGELSVVKIGSNENHQRWYVEDGDWNRWIEARRA